LFDKYQLKKKIEMNRRSKYYFFKLNVIGTVTKQLIVDGLKIQFLLILYLISFYPKIQASIE